MSTSDRLIKIFLDFTALGESRQFAATSPSITSLTGGGSKKEYKTKNGFKRYWSGEMWGALFYLLKNGGVVIAGRGDNGSLENWPISCIRCSRL